jgi:hypothetical protein
LHRRFDRRFRFSTVGSSGAPLKRGSYLSYPLAAASNSNPILFRPSHPRPYAAALSAFGEFMGARASSAAIRSHRRLPVPAAGRRSAPLAQSLACAAAAPDLGFGRRTDSGQAPPPGLAGDPKEERKAQSLSHSRISSTPSRCGEHKPNFPPPLHYS